MSIKARGTSFKGLIMDLLPLFSRAAIHCFFLENKKFTCLSRPSRRDVSLSFLKELALGIQSKIEGEGEKSWGEFSLLSLSPAKIEGFLLFGVQQPKKIFFIGKKIDLKFKIQMGCLEEDLTLSGGEKEFLSLLLKGLETEEIAKTLGISSSHIKDRQTRIMRKLGAKNRIDLFWKAASGVIPVIKNEVQ